VIGEGGDTVPKAGSAEALRRRFDESFAHALGSSPERVEDLLAIRVGTHPHVLRLSEIAGLSAGLRIAPVPSPVGSLLGIVGVRGMMAPIYDLGMLLGYPPVRAPQTVGFAFEAFESHLQVLASSVTGKTVRAAGALRPIVDMPSVVAMLKGLIS
jgi:hypothetical protein